MPSQISLFYGTFVHLPRRKTGDKHELEIRHGALWVSPTSGRIEGFDWSVSGEEELQALIRKRWPSTEMQVRIVRAREDQNEFFFPGFIDTHIHAPQYPNTGLFGSSTLLDWLSTYTFPLESSLSDPTLKTARKIYNTVITRTLANGTTTASYFATIHVPATNLLATLCHTHGQRALIGRVCMDNPSFCPPNYLDPSPTASTLLTEAVISHIHSLDASGTLLKPIITPRFAPSCTREALTCLSTLAKSHSPPLHIQTHISENKSEIDLVASLFPECDSYAAVYDKHDLLTERTILAHAVHLSPAEKELIAARGAKIAHCPSSNSALGSGIAHVRGLLRAGITVGLGTDVSGGYNPGVLEVVRQACLVSRLVPFTTPSSGSGGEQDEAGDDAVLSVEEALYLGTRGGAEVVDMAGDIGGFDKGMFWDAQLVRLGGGPASASASTTGSFSSALHAASAVDVFGWESWTEKVHKWVWSGDDRNVRGVWVGGRLVHAVEGFQEEENTNCLKLGWEWQWQWVLGGVGVGALALVLGRRGF